MAHLKKMFIRLAAECFLLLTQSKMTEDEPTIIERRPLSLFWVKNSFRRIGWCVFHSIQCDRIAKLFLIFGYLQHRKFCPIICRVGSKFRQIQNKPWKIDHKSYTILPKLWNFAKSGHTAYNLLHQSNSFENISTSNLMTLHKKGSSSSSTLKALKFVYLHLCTKF